MKKQRRMSSTIILHLSIFLSIFLILVSSGIYLFVSKEVEKITINKNIDTSNQINQNFISYFDILISSSQNINNLISNIDIKESNVDDILKLSIELYDHVDGAILIDENFNVVSQTSELIIQKNWFNHTYNDNTMYHFYSEYNETDEVYNGFIARKIEYLENGTVNYGVIFIKMNFSRIFAITNNTNLGLNGHISMIDVNNDIIFSTNNNIDTDKYVKDLILGTDTIKYEYTNLQVYLNTISNSPWRIAIFINIDNIYITNNQLLLTLVFITITCIVVTLYVVQRISYRVTSPLANLENIMKEIEDSRNFLEIKESDSGISEIISLTTRFNEMIKEIKLLIDKVIIEQKSQRLSELKSLQNQINPHFLYNTLDSIVWLAENNENEKVVEMTIALSNLFRISISRGNFIIPVKDEIKHAECYLTIQKIRYQEAFDYSIEVSDDIKDLPTMKLTLQPLIENAIYHGLRNRVDPGFISIKAYLDKEHIIFEVTDNGYGIREEKIEELYKTFKDVNLHDGVGMKNVYQRLMIYFNSQADLTIISELDEGTTIKISIKRDENEKNNIINSN